MQAGTAPRGVCLLSPLTAHGRTRGVIANTRVSRVASFCLR